MDEAGFCELGASPKCGCFDGFDHRDSGCRLADADLLTGRHAIGWRSWFRRWLLGNWRIPQLRNPSSTFQQPVVPFGFPLCSSRTSLAPKKTSASAFEMPQPNTEGEFTIAAAYGQACLACSSSKTKCRFRPGGDSCERCFRRGKECRRGPVKRRDTGKRAVSRTARLEERLDNLVLLLQNQHEGARVNDSTTSISNIANVQRTVDQVGLALHGSI